MFGKFFTEIAVGEQHGLATIMAQTVPITECAVNTEAWINRSDKKNS